MDVTALLTLEPIGQDRYRSSTRTGRQRAFGGEVMGQAIAAGNATVPSGRPAHVLQAQFLRAARGDNPIEYHVARLHDGKSFSTRTVSATQGGTTVFTATISYHEPEHGVMHQPPMPDIPGPEGLPDEHALREALAVRPGINWVRNPVLWNMGVEIRAVRPRDYISPETGWAYQAFWIRAKTPPPPALSHRQAMISYLSDIMLLGATLLPHGLHWSTTPVQEASLNHSIWFHRPPNFDDWILWFLETPWAANGRGLATGKFWNKDGGFTASVAQEGLIRVKGKAQHSGTPGR